MYAMSDNWPTWHKSGKQKACLLFFQTEEDRLAGKEIETEEVTYY